MDHDADKERKNFTCGGTISVVAYACSGGLVLGADSQSSYLQSRSRSSLKRFNWGLEKIQKLNSSIFLLISGDVDSATYIVRCLKERGLKGESFDNLLKALSGLIYEKQHNSDMILAGYDVIKDCHKIFRVCGPKEDWGVITYGKIEETNFAVAGSGADAEQVRNIEYEEGIELNLAERKVREIVLTAESVAESVDKCCGGEVQIVSIFGSEVKGFGSELKGWNSGKSRGRYDCYNPFCCMIDEFCPH